MKVEILKKKESPFKGEDGERIPYFWYTARNQETNIRFQFGSSNGDYQEGQNLDLNIEKYERKDGKVAYKEFND